MHLEISLSQLKQLEIEQFSQTPDVFTAIFDRHRSHYKFREFY
jgi:hypothetical protein